MDEGARDSAQRQTASRDIAHYYDRNTVSFLAFDY